MVRVLVRDIDERRLTQPINLLCAGIILQPPATPIDRTDEPWIGYQQGGFPPPVQREARVTERSEREPSGSCGHVNAPAAPLTARRHQRRQEFAQHGRPFGVLRPARRVAEIAVYFEITRVDTRSSERIHHPGSNRRWKEPVGPAQHIKDFRLDLAKILHAVITDRGAPQDHQRVGIETPRPICSELPYRYFTRVAAWIAIGQRR